jgi:hypothetical protein
MNNFEAEKIVTCSLIKLGAFCRIESTESGLNNLIVSWKRTIWRIMVRTTNKDISSLWPLDDDIRLFKQKASFKNQIFVIAFVHTNNIIEYRAVEDGRIIRPRCIIKVKRANVQINAYNNAD